jgi:hypothetical protein
MKRSRKLSLLLVSLAFISSVTFMTLEAGTKSPTSRPREVTPLKATCFCKISKDNLLSSRSATGVIKDLTGEVDRTFTFQGSDQQNTCQALCKSKAEQYVKSQSIATAACAANVPDHTLIVAYSAVGTRTYDGAEVIGTLQNIPQDSQTTCTCPANWVCNGCSPQRVGGVTTDGKCWKVVCKGNAVPPYPPDGTPIGSWGFSRGDAFFEWGTAANRGAPHCDTLILRPNFCGWY